MVCKKQFGQKVPVLRIKYLELYVIGITIFLNAIFYEYNKVPFHRSLIFILKNMKIVL
jgi:hypothetical protein